MTAKSNIYKLKYTGLPLIEDLPQFSDQVRVSISFIKFLLFSGDTNYKTYELKKKCGGARLIAQPSRKLKAFQSWILRKILDNLRPFETCKGFEIGSSTKDNASPHIGNNVMLAFDIENFFPSIKANKVYNIFHSLGYNKKISSILTSLCTFNGALPQGSPASPKLANLICSRLDARVQGFAGKNDIVYTRYADDICLSSQSLKVLLKARAFVPTIIAEEDFKLNKNKTRLMGYRYTPKATGLIIHRNRIGVGRKIYRDLRSKIHYLFMGKSEKYDHVNGWIAYIYGVDSHIYGKLNSYIKKLEEKNPTSPAKGKLFQKAI